MTKLAFILFGHKGQSVSSDIILIPNKAKQRFIPCERKTKNGTEKTGKSLTMAIMYICIFGQNNAKSRTIQKLRWNGSLQQDQRYENDIPLIGNVQKLIHAQPKYSLKRI